MKATVQRLNDKGQLESLIGTGEVTGRTTTFVKVTNPKLLMDEWFPLNSKKLKTIIHDNESKTTNS